MQVVSMTRVMVRYLTVDGNPTRKRGTESPVIPRLRVLVPYQCETIKPAVPSRRRCCLRVARALIPKSLQHRQPHIAQRCVLRQDEMLAQFQVGSAAGENRWAIGQVVDGADVRSEGHGGVVEEARSVGFLCGLEFVDQAGQ